MYDAQNGGLNEVQSNSLQEAEAALLNWLSSAPHSIQYGGLNGGQYGDQNIGLNNEQVGGLSGCVIFTCLLYTI